MHLWIIGELIYLKKCFPLLFGKNLRGSNSICHSSIYCIKKSAKFIEATIFIFYILQNAVTYIIAGYHYDYLYFGATLISACFYWQIYYLVKIKLIKNILLHFNFPHFYFHLPKISVCINWKSDFNVTK